mmetsp:Transcript_11492/g.24252  ORF Transcript_11492/g.24252 Transcript_11492/m.24252 type:complete len:249 (+) Transcript_11492:159-905(+)|eukprot:CAMPEP_0168195376 /NCGR_PEP_ID=MMETSP0139_2-20121125/19804_1 /TAXON_ID=44445 /ORGANISM="Pseudo-nitzschia australis, Strain 10249 10 AB" /LENGTH=248 /DNA_ID=CAMNT_0008119189 /DNA_START=99 /DNA_END=845 /DNA_ORIENTATION=+
MLGLRLLLISLFVVLLFLLPRSSESCISCYHPRAIAQNPNNHRHGSHAIAVAVPQGIFPYGANGRSKSIAAATAAGRQCMEIFKERWLKLHNSIYAIPQFSKSHVRISASVAIAAGGIAVLSRHHLPLVTSQKLHRGLWRNEATEGQDDVTRQNDENIVDDDFEQDSVMSTAMIATIGVYKNFISPLLPPACRFVPTCSQYGVQAIKEYGPSKGVVLTSWRLLRCSPFGGKGYDPPKWPPVAYTYSSY